MRGGSRRLSGQTQRRYISVLVYWVLAKECLVIDLSDCLHCVLSPVGTLLRELNAVLHELLPDLARVKRIHSTLLRHVLSLGFSFE